MAAPEYDPMRDSFLPVTSSGLSFRTTTSEASRLTPATTDSFGLHHVPSPLHLLSHDNPACMETRINTALTHPAHSPSSNTLHPAPAVDKSISRRLMSQWLEHKGCNWGLLDPMVNDRVDQAEHMLVAESDYGCVKLEDLFICSTGETFAGPSDLQWGTERSQYRRIHIQAPGIVGAILSGAMQTKDLPTVSEQAAQGPLPRIRKATRDSNRYGGRGGSAGSTRDNTRITPGGKLRGIRRDPGSSRGSVDRDRATKHRRRG